MSQRRAEKYEEVDGNDESQQVLSVLDEGGLPGPCSTGPPRRLDQKIFVGIAARISGARRRHCRHAGYVTARQSISCCP